MMTSRDFDIIDFLIDYQIATTSTIASKFFTSGVRCQIRMKQLYDDKRVKRARLSFNHDYMYYVNKPKQYMHQLLITEFYGELMRNSNVITFTKSKKIGNIIPDSIFAYEIDGVKKLGLLEVEISNKGFDYEKYEKFFLSGEYSNYFPEMPPVYIVCKNARIPKNTPVKFIKIKTDLSNFKIM